MDSTIFIASQGPFPTLDSTWPYKFFVTNSPTVTGEFDNLYELNHVELYGYITQAKAPNLAATRQMSITQMLNRSAQMQPQKMIWKKEKKDM